MADEESGDKVGGWDVKMKAEMKARLEKRKRHHSCSDAGEPHQLPPLGNALVGQPTSPSLLGDVTPELVVEKRRRHHSTGSVTVAPAELGGGDAPDAALLQHPPQLEVDRPPPNKTPGKRKIDEIAELVG